MLDPITPTVRLRWWLAMIVFCLLAWSAIGGLAYWYASSWN